MEPDLDRSLKLLDDAVSTQGRGLLKNRVKDKNLNMSFTLNASELHYLEQTNLNMTLLDQSLAAAFDKAGINRAAFSTPAMDKAGDKLQGDRLFKTSAFEKPGFERSNLDQSAFDKPTLDKSAWEKSAFDNSAYDKFDNTVLGKSAFEKTTLEKSGFAKSVVSKSREPWASTLDNLFIEFFEVLQTHSSIQDVLQVLEDFWNSCEKAIEIIDGLKKGVQDAYWLLSERNVWKLLHILYQDRLSTMALDDAANTTPYTGYSEKVCCQQLFQRDQLVRESQLIIDWLEYVAKTKNDPTLHFTSSTNGWENTLYDIKTGDDETSTRSRKLVSELHPDAPYCEKLPLHDLDIENDKILCLRIFTEIRCGNLEEVQKICKNSGHAWRAALLEGWRLFHDPKVNDDKIEEVDKESQGEVATTVVEVTPKVSLTLHRDPKEPKPDQIEGNPHRDAWKIMGLQYCQKDYLNKYEKAAVAAYCGHLGAVLTVAKDWDDYLWSYMKVMVDIRVESEIRDNVKREYHVLAPEYWEQKMSINDIFNALESCPNDSVREESTKPIRVIEKHIILDEIETLIETMDEWLENSDSTSHFIRFLTHLLLFFEQIGKTPNRAPVERALEKYVRHLMEMNDTQLVAYYISKMNSQLQVPLYASYLERILDNEERRQALELGISCDIDVFAVTKRIVENIRSIAQLSYSENLPSKITELDKKKISAMDWLLFYDEQRAEALIQTNVLIFMFLTLKNLDAAHLVFNKIPENSVEFIMSEGDVSDIIRQAIKEHLSYKAYLDAQEAFNDWYKLFKSKPIPPAALGENAPFTEKVAHEHQMTHYKAETERWKLSTSHLAKTAKALLYNVLLFPDGGWLAGAKDAEYLRSTCIPECVLLLYSVLFESGMHEECVQLADILASEKYCLYKVYSKEKLSEILVKLCESSTELLNEKKDPWGNERTS